MDDSTKKEKKPRPRSPAEIRRDAVRETTKRNARGNIQLTQGEIVLPSDKNLAKLEDI